MSHRFLAPALALSAALAALSVPAAAQLAPSADRSFANPPVLQQLPSTLLQRSVPTDALGAPRHLGSERKLELVITYSMGRMYNPSTGNYDTLRLRSYQGTGMNPDRPFISPTIDVTPGDTVRVALDNQLPADPSCLEHSTSSVVVDTPHCFNGTNLHTHGLWVSPTGNSDNVLLSINPGVKFEYEYNIPSDHPSGTFWYHTHRHGSTALQVSSGMAGALIIRGDRPPTPNLTGDLDTLLKPGGGQTFQEQLLVLQQIQYACLNADGTVMMKDGNVVWNCPNPDDLYGIESYDQFGPNSWTQSGRFTSINGEIMPSFAAASG